MPRYRARAGFFTVRVEAWRVVDAAALAVPELPQETRAAFLRGRLEMAVTPEGQREDYPAFGVGRWAEMWRAYRVTSPKGVNL